MSAPTEIAPAPALTLGLKPGELARVRSAKEIFATLDERGMLDGLPFMPEMLKYCGRTLPVTQRADKTCAGDGVVRRMHDTVHLQSIRCDGSAHDGCQAACLMFWKEAWLERAGDAPARNGAAAKPEAQLDDEEQGYVERVLAPETSYETEDGRRYRCQATDILTASEPLRFRQFDQYMRDRTNWSTWHIVKGLFVEVFNLYQGWSNRHVPKRLLIGGGRQWPFVKGQLEKGKTPVVNLDLQPGDLVRIKSKEEIEATLDVTNHNRGLSFDNEMSNYCGRTARVRGRVNRLIEESNGKMLNLKSDCIILENVVCAGDYHRFCPRAIFPYWREVWLEKVDGPPQSGPGASACSGC